MPATATVLAPEETRQPETAPSGVSYAEYLALAGEENRLIEWVAEEVIVHMPPLTVHALLADFLSQLLSLFVQLTGVGLVISAPFEVKLWPDGPSREPDVFFLARERHDRLTERRLEGAPDLAVEIVSEESATRDRLEKFDEYEQAGVREYWIVDPRSPRPRAWFYALDPSGIFNPLLPDADGRLHSSALPGFWLRPDWLWQDPLPAPLEKLAEIVGAERLGEVIRRA